MIAGNLGNAFDAELVERIEQAASERKFTTLVCTTGRHPEDETAKIGTLLEQRVAGIAMLQFNGDRQLMAQLVSEHVPVVMVSCWDDYVDCVAVDDSEGLELAVGHLAAAGPPPNRVPHRRAGREHHPTDPAGGVRACAPAPRTHLRTRLGDPRHTSGTPASSRTSSPVCWSAEDRPEAIVATNDNIAITLIEQLESLGCRVPDDVSVVGFDGSRVAALSRIGLTTIAQPVEQLARSSVELLLQRVLGDIPTSDGMSGSSRV